MMLQSDLAFDDAQNRRTGLWHRVSEIATEYSWISIFIGAISMAATYPGRTHGLGMVTEPLLLDFGLDSNDGRVLYATLGLLATIIGASFCIPVGWLLDRIGQRWVLFGTMFSLGLSVIWLSQSRDLVTLFLGLLLTRGLGQAALSVVSITVVSNSHHPSRLGMAMAFYAILGMPMHLILIGFVGWVLNTAKLDWRIAWGLVGLALLLISAVSWFLPKASDSSALAKSHSDESNSLDSNSYSMMQAIRTPAFWLFSITISLWGMIYAGTALFNQDIFREQGFGPEMYFRILSLTTLVALGSKLLFGWLVNYIRLTHLLSSCLLLSAFSLAGLPFAYQAWHAYAYGILLGISSGAVALLFFAVWGMLYGRRELGQIQGLAQMMTVFASASGPLVFSWSKRMTSSYSAIFFLFAATLAAMALISLLTPLPKAASHSTDS